MAKLDVCIDLGSQNTSLCLADTQYVLTEPSVVAYSGEVVCVGIAAIKLARMQRNVKLIHPIDEAVVIDANAAKDLVLGLLDKLLPNKLFIPRVSVLCILACGLNSSDKKAYEAVFNGVGVKQTRFVETPKCVLRRANTQLNMTSGIVIDIGNSHTEIAAVKGNEILSGCTLSIGGKQIANVIKSYVDKKYGVDLPFEQAMAIKDNCASLYPNDASIFDVSALNVDNKHQEMFSVTSRELYDSISGIVDNIVTVVKSIFASIDETNIFELRDNGIILSGGNSLIVGLEKYLVDKLQLPVKLLDSTQLAAVKGGVTLFK